MSGTTSPKQAAAQGIALGFIAGYVDTVGFVALFGLFTAHVTGNFVLIGSELATPTSGVLIKFIAFFTFVLAVAFTRLALLWLERGGKPVLLALYLIEAVLLLLFLAFGTLALPVTDAGAPLTILAGAAAAAAMGVQNAGSRLVLQHLTPTTVMTGNVTQLVIDWVDIARGAADEVARARSGKFFWPIVAFAAGAIGGAFAYAWVAFMALALPIAALLWLCAGERQAKA
jgi:uncharacterized membrane protein YoaK (UPF0700 family)